MVYYQDTEIILRDVKESDVISFFAWSIDKKNYEYDPKPMPQNATELLKACQSYCLEFETQIINPNIDLRKYMFFVITDLYDSPIGYVNFFSIDNAKKQGEMGIIIASQSHLKKGIGFKAINASTNYIFDNLDIKRIYIETGDDNKAALKLFEKADFKKCDEIVEDENFKFIVMEKLAE